VEVRWASGRTTTAARVAGGPVVRGRMSLQPFG
jgi:hypothetical protein